MDRSTTRWTRPALIECRVCPSRETADLCNVEPGLFSEFEAIRHTLVYRPGQFLFYEGHAVLGLYILCSGRVKLTRTTARGQCRLVGIVDPGQLIEKHTFQDGAVHEVTCEAIEPSQVCVLDRTKYLAFLERHGELAVRLVKLLSRTMGSSLEESDQLAFASARERIAGLLLELANRYGEPAEQGIRIALQLRREELAQMAAMTTETAVRILTALHTKKIIEIHGREITICQADRLARAARRLSSP